MPSTNKTSNLQLNSWIGTDKPIRSDFVQDNQIIDNAVATHTNNSNIHLTTLQREWLNRPFMIDAHIGTGEAEQTFNFTKAPKAVIYFQEDEPFSKNPTTGNYTICHSGIATSAFGATTGLSLSSTTLTITQSQTTPSAGGVYCNLGENNKAYIIIAIF